MKKALFLFVFSVIAFYLNAQITPGAFYKIQNNATGFYAGIDGKTNQGDPVLQQSTVGDGGLWEFVAHAGGYFAIKNKVSGKYIDNFSSIAPAAALKQNTGINDGALWSLVDAGGGYFKLKNKKNNMFMGINGATATHTPVVQLLTVTEGGKWKLEMQGVEQSVEVFYIKNKQSGLNATTGSTVSQTNGTGDNVKWEFTASGSNYQIKNKQSGLYLINSFGVASVNNTPELWAIETLSNPAGHVQIKHVSTGKYLKSNNQSPGAGALLVADKLTTDFGIWKLELLSSGGNAMVSNSGFINFHNIKFRNATTTTNPETQVPICDRINQLSGNASLMAKYGVDGATLNKIKQIICDEQPLQINTGTHLTAAQKQIFDGFVQYFNENMASNGLSGTFQQYFALWEQADMNNWSSIFDSYKAANGITDNTVKPKIQTWISRRGEVITAMNKYRDSYIKPLNDRAVTDLNSISTNLGMDAGAANNDNDVVLGYVTGVSKLMSSVPIVGTAMSGLAAAAPAFLDLILIAEYPSYTSAGNTLKISTANLVEKMAKSKEFSLKMSEFMQYAILSDINTMMNQATSDMVTKFTNVQANSFLNTAVNTQQSLLQKEFWKILLPARAFIVSEYKSESDFPGLYTNVEVASIPSFSSDEDYVAFSKYYYTPPAQNRNYFIFKWALRIGAPDQNTIIGNAGGLGYANIYQHFPNTKDLIDLLWIYHKPLFGDTGLNMAASNQKDIDKILWVRDIINHYEKIPRIENERVIEQWSTLPGIGTPVLQLWAYFKPVCYAFRGAAMVDRTPFFVNFKNTGAYVANFVVTTPDGDYECDVPQYQERTVTFAKAATKLTAKVRGGAELASINNPGINTCYKSWGHLAAPKFGEGCN